jgi:hypothetical protein
MCAAAWGRSPLSSRQSSVMSTRLLYFSRSFQFAMPIVNLNRDRLFEALGEEFST